MLGWSGCVSVGGNVHFVVRTSKYRLFDEWIELKENWIER